MEEPLTEDMLAELLDAPDPRAFIGKREVGERSLSEYLNALFTGARRASRDNLLKIAFAMGCTLREANRLLQAGGANELYCKNRRDAIIIFALSHGYSLQKTEEELYRFDETTIS